MHQTITCVKLDRHLLITAMFEMYVLRGHIITLKNNMFFSMLIFNLNINTSTNNNSFFCISIKIPVIFILTDNATNE